MKEHYSRESLKKDYFQCNLLFFYSFKDLEYSFGFDQLKDHLTLQKPKRGKNWILQTRAIMGGLGLILNLFDKKTKLPIPRFAGLFTIWFIRFSCFFRFTNEFKNVIG